VLAQREGALRKLAIAARWVDRSASKEEAGFAQAHQAFTEDRVSPRKTSRRVPSAHLPSTLRFQAWAQPEGAGAPSQFS
jgi:hypothetical protein